MTTAVLAVLGAVAAVAAAGGFLVWRSRAPRGQVYYRFRCPGCDHKLRYPAGKAGSTAVCPACRRRSVLPPPG